MSQEQMAAQLKVSRQTIYRYERGLIPRRLLNWIEDEWTRILKQWQVSRSE